MTGCDPESAEKKVKKKKKVKEGEGSLKIGVEYAASVVLFGCICRHPLDFILQVSSSECPTACNASVF